MAVAQYPFPICGGLEKQAHELSKSLIRQGHVVSVLSSCFDSTHQESSLVDGVRVYRTHWMHSRLGRFTRSPFSLTRRLFELRCDVDVVHVHNVSWFGAFVTSAAKILGLPVINKLPNIGVDGIPGMRDAPFGAMRVEILKQSDAVIAMTSESVAELAEIGFPSRRIFTVTNGISLSSMNTRALLRSRSEALRVVFVGRLVPTKGLLDLLHAWATVVAQAKHPVKLRIIGEGPQEFELRAVASALHLDEFVDFVGYSDDVSAELKSADLFVLPSVVEGNSNALLEAMREGLSVVATRVAGAPIQVGSEGQQFLISPGDRTALATQLLKLIDDEPLRNQVGAAMRERIIAVFDIDKIAMMYQQAYTLLVSGRRDQIGHINAGMFTKRG